MNWEDVLKLIAVILSIGGTTYGAVRFVLSERAKQSSLATKIIQLQQQLDLVSTTLREGVNRYQSLRELSSSAQTAIGADLHSISIPVPRNNPTHFKIIVSTDREAEKIIGKEFPITKGLAGRVYANRRPEYVNKAIDDPKHYKVVDQAAGTDTGEGAILTYPLVRDGSCSGVIQFMKARGFAFHDEDVTIVGRFADRITSELANLEQSDTNDPRFGSAPGIFTSVMFSDINDYSVITKQMSLYQAVNLLDEYYRRMLNVALSNDAAFEEYLGDGVYLSFYGRTKNESVLSAMSCARAMQREYETLQSEWIAFDYPITGDNFHNIGIASGTVFEGTIGHLQHRKRKLIGPAVDRAAHLVELAKNFGGCILVDKITHDLAAAIETTFELKSGEPEGYLMKDKKS
jgi:class 3 adenylate cyclase